MSKMSVSAFNPARASESNPATDRVVVNSSSCHFAFGVRDTKGREIGARVNTFMTDVVPATNGRMMAAHFPVGRYYGAEVRVTRDGKGFGPSTGPFYFRTAEERDAYVDASLMHLRRRHGA